MLAPSRSSSDPAGRAPALPPGSVPQPPAAHTATPDAAARGPAVSQLVMSGVVELIRTANYEGVHDSQLARDYVTSLRRGLNDICGASAFHGTGKLAPEGVQDGRRLAEALGCRSAEFKTMAANAEEFDRRRTGAPVQHDEILWSFLMSPEYRAKHGIPDPQTALRDRALRVFADAVQKACVDQYTSATFCTCLVNGLRDDGATTDDWQAMAKSLDAITAIGLDRKQVRARVRSCSE